MKPITVFFVSLTLFFTIGCNYDYGKYGKDKKDKNTEQTQQDELNSYQFHSDLLALSLGEKIII